MVNKKDQILGMPVTTATQKLRKKIIFDFLQRLGEDFCFRCGAQIEKIEELSIEHKESWQLSPNPQESFLDLDNVTFSHILCNSYAGSLSSAAIRSAAKYDEKGDKKCGRCKVYKEISAFHKNAHRSDGYKDACYDCCREIKRLDRVK